MRKARLFTYFQYAPGIQSSLCQAVALPEWKRFSRRVHIRCRRVLISTGGLLIIVCLAHVAVSLPRFTLQPQLKFWQARQLFDAALRNRRAVLPCLPVFLSLLPRGVLLKRGQAVEQRYTSKR